MSKQESSFFNDFLIGAAGFMIAKLVSAPFERMKTVTQTRSYNHQDPTHEFPTGLFPATKRVIEEQGFFSLWKGVSLGILRYYPTQMLNFAFRGYYNILVEKLLVSEKDEKKISNIRQFIINFTPGFLAGATTLCFTYPIDVFHTLYLTDIHSRYSSSFNLISTFIAEYGLRSLFPGFSTTIAGIFIYRCSYFACYDLCVSILQQDESYRSNPSFIVQFLLSIGVTTFAGLVSYPFDTIRRVMIVNILNDSKTFTTTLGCIHHIHQNYGIAGFFRGYPLSFLKALSSSLALVLMDTMLAFRNKK